MARTKGAIFRWRRNPLRATRQDWAALRRRAMQTGPYGRQLEGLIPPGAKHQRRKQKKVARSKAQQPSAEAQTTASAPALVDTAGSSAANPIVIPDDPPPRIGAIAPLQPGYRSRFPFKAWDPPTKEVSRVWRVCVYDEHEPRKFRLGTPIPDESKYVEQFHFSTNA